MDLSVVPVAAALQCSTSLGTCWEVLLRAVDVVRTGMHVVARRNAESLCHRLHGESYKGLAPPRFTTEHRTAKTNQNDR